MALHERLQQLLLIGVRPSQRPRPPHVEPPVALAELVQAVRPAWQALDAQAVAMGHRYRSAFWALYLLSAVAVMLAVMPVALGWAATEHPLHRHAVLWGVLEVVVIASVALLYWRGGQQDWKGRWLAARAEAEMAGYLPLAAALRGAHAREDASDWYAGLYGAQGWDEPAGPTVARLCREQAPGLDRWLSGAWQDEAFLRGFAAWTASELSGQCHYHHRTAERHHALLARGHRVSAGLFGLTALGALLHLFWHADVLMIATTSFPAFGAALHGALVQSEAHRLAENSVEMEQALARLTQRIEQVLQAPQLRGAPAQQLYDAAHAALGLILQEHKGWHAVVRPHHLPLG